MPNKKKTADRPFWGYLIHLGYNMWSDRPGTDQDPHIGLQPKLRLDVPTWEAILDRMAEAGLDLLVIDLGEGIRYKSHPELAVKGSWKRKRLRKELDRIRARGIEPIPKLNFSTAHDVWLGPYARMVSTGIYYEVCRDLIREATDLFDGPRFFHLGMDEETAAHQRRYEYAVMRQHDLWWNDTLYLAEQVEKAGSRSWLWSDYVWHHKEEFYERMPKSVLQSNWYYDAGFSRTPKLCWCGCGKKISYVQAFLDLEIHGYDQVPTGSVWAAKENFGRLATFSRKQIAPERLFGFLQTVWNPTIPECLDRHIHAIDTAARARKAFLRAVGTR